jgi:hypothetical protein
MVDCSAILKSWEFNHIELLDLATKLCEPFGIRCAGRDGREALDRHGQGRGPRDGRRRARPRSACPRPRASSALTPGRAPSKCWTARAAWLACSRCPTARAGSCSPARARTASGRPLIEGENILSGSVEYDATARYRRYMVGAQHPATEDWLDGSVTNAVSGSATDENVRRAERVLMIRPEASCTPAMATCPRGLGGQGSAPRAGTP